MCDYGNQVILNVPIPGHLSFEGVDVWKDKPIDSCIAPIVKALNDAGIYTVASCCGHGKGGGSIILWDDRELVLARTWEFRELEAEVERLKKSNEWLRRHLAEYMTAEVVEREFDPRAAGPLLRKSREMEQGRIHG